MIGKIRIASDPKHVRARFDIFLGLAVSDSDISCLNACKSTIENCLQMFQSTNYRRL